MLRIRFRKEGKARFISHLDLMRTMQRAFIRAGVPIRHTEGFNPHPYMTFALPLSVGTESVCELMDFEPAGAVDIAALPAALTAKMPEGITVTDAYEGNRKFKDIKWLDIEAHLFYDSEVCDVPALRELFSRDALVIDKRTKRSTAQVDIRPLIDRIGIYPAGEREAVIRARLAAQEPSLSPAQLVSAIGQLSPALTPDFAAFRRLEVYDRDMTLFR